MSVGYRAEALRLRTTARKVSRTPKNSKGTVITRMTIDRRIDVYVYILYIYIYTVMHSYLDLYVINYLYVYSRSVEQHFPFGTPRRRERQRWCFLEWFPPLCAELERLGRGTKAAWHSQDPSGDNPSQPPTTLGAKQYPHTNGRDRKEVSAWTSLCQVPNPSMPLCKLVECLVERSFCHTATTGIQGLQKNTSFCYVFNSTRSHPR